ncbi:UdgX family uracil-DNA binding protein [Caulobacter sp. RL271]|jgi:DNA polymerase|uniref:Type-4 uracil-DNA glycosylase n=1 Tax=Caulobacter segnis TaxID=88688 RepID=A0ABY4ZQ57_9CAUL|nr:UdgX family uracil-DNA binding protein [Caulobacter segnis]USQ94524.1 UdgX family uracil-DNA binding protein [Caulobacter segnis]
MRVARLASEIDFTSWRAAARTLRAEGVAPQAVVWTVERELFDLAPPSPTPAPASAHFTVPAAFVELAEQVILHRAPDRLALLYRILWRLEREPRLIDNPADPDMARARDMAKAVSRASHKMKAFVRFRLIEGAVGSRSAETYAAWFEPAHRVTEATAPFFVRRFTNLDWTILTPDACVAWDRERLTVSEGADPADAPSEDAQEELWRTYYASIFNPARLNPRQMRQEMPKRYWRNLPEAALIPDLIETAQERAAAMVAARPSKPPERKLKAALRHARDASYDGSLPTSLDDVAAGVEVCRRCDLWRDATQGVPGEGAPKAALMFVGEQPGDQEDLAGRPFVGPAGQMFDRALAEAGVPRDRTFVTNAVKHFKHEPRGKRRLHRTPDRGEVTACRWWLDAERRLVKPRVIVMLGATAALGVMGKPTPIGANRGKALQLSGQARGVVTYHPAFLLRVPDEEARARAYAEFVQDLRLAGELAGV